MHFQSLLLFPAGHCDFLASSVSSAQRADAAECFMTLSVGLLGVAFLFFHFFKQTDKKYVLATFCVIKHSKRLSWSLSAVSTISS